MTFRIILAFLAVIALSPMASAQSNAPIDPHLAAAMDLLEATNAKQIPDAFIDAIIPGLIARARRDNSNLSDSAIRSAEAAIREELMSGLDDVMKNSAKVYAEHFSEQELRTLAQFFRSDPGKKYLAEILTITREASPIIRAWEQAAIQHAQERLKRNGVSP